MKGKVTSVDRVRSVDVVSEVALPSLESEARV